MSDAIANEMTIREFFDKLQERLTFKDGETGETIHVLARDKELLSFLKGDYKSDHLDEKTNGRVIYDICCILHYLRRALYNVITKDIKGPYSKEIAIENYKKILKTDYEKKDELKT